MTNRQTDVSIIIPIYNSEEYLVRCIESVLNQSYENFELILVDDGSTDNSLCICNSFSQKYNNITVIHKNNGGVSSARNEGIKNSHGKYLMFVDSDDYITKNCIELLMRCTADIVIGEITCNFRKFEKTTEHNYYSRIVERNEFKDVLPELLEEAKLNYLHGKLYKSSIIDRYQLCFEDFSVRYGEDTVFNFNYIIHCENLYLSDGIVYYYNRNDSGLARSYREDRYIKQSSLCSYIEEICIENDLYSSEMKRAVDNRRVQLAEWETVGLLINDSLSYSEKIKHLGVIKNDSKMRIALENTTIEDIDNLIHLVRKGPKLYISHYKLNNYSNELYNYLVNKTPKPLKKIVANLKKLNNKWRNP